MPLPNFLIIGAAKSGTTSLQSYLNQHPQVYFSPWKEPNFFALDGEKLPRNGPAPPEVLFDLIHRHSVTDFLKYSSLFEGVREERAIGEASVRYLYFDKAPPRIRNAIPDVKLIIILREPVSRLYSHYCMNVQYQLEPLSLLDALQAEETRRQANWGWDWHYANVSLYFNQVKRYFDYFNRDQIKVYLYDDFVESPLTLYKDVCRHIGVNDQFIPDMSGRGKVAYRPKNLVFDRWLHWPSRSRTALESLFPRALWRRMFLLAENLNGAPVPKLDPGIRKDLARHFREDVLQLENLLNRNIPWYARK